MKLTRLAAALPVCALLLSGCGTDGPPQADAPTVTVTETATAPPEAAEAVAVAEQKADKEEAIEEEALKEETAPEPTEEEAEPAEAGASEGQAAFGDTWTWDDGLEVTVSKPESFKPGEYAFGGEGYDNHVKFTVTIENKTGEPFDSSLFFLTAQSGTSEGDEVFDDDLGGSPSTTLLDGRSVAFDTGFGVEDPDDIVLEMAPSFDHDAAIFTN